LPAISHGCIVVNLISQHTGAESPVDDGSTTTCDVMVLAIAYRMRFPFLATDLFDPERLPIRLYRRMMQ